MLMMMLLLIVHDYLYTAARHTLGHISSEPAGSALYIRRLMIMLFRAQVLTLLTDARMYL